MRRGTHLRFEKSASDRKPPGWTCRPRPPAVGVVEGTDGDAFFVEFDQVTPEVLAEVQARSGRRTRVEVQLLSLRLHPEGGRRSHAERLLELHHDVVAQRGDP